MMDAKTAVEILKRDFKTIDKSLGLKPISIDGANEIADFIEQQEKYAELGRLALKVDACPYMFGSRYCRNCGSFEFCQKRAKLLVEEVREE